MIKYKNHILLWLFSFTLLAFLYLNHLNTLSQQKNQFIENNKKEAAGVAYSIENQFKYITQLIRAISSFSSIQEIDRLGKNFNEDNRNSLRQLYRYAYLNVALSEIYITAKDFNPEKLDPSTSKKEEPILMFDDFIATNNETTDSGTQLEEVENEEYFVLKDQLRLLIEKFSKRELLPDNTNPPILSSRSVITCDNSDFTEKDLKSNNDEPRKGILFSTPFYDSTGNLKGAVTAVVRNRILSNSLPKGKFLLVNNSGATFTNEPATYLLEYIENLKKNIKSPLIFSDKLSLNRGDEAGPWILYSAASDEDFYNQPEVKNTKLIFYASVILLLIVSIGITLFFINANRKKMLIANIAKNLNDDSSEIITSVGSLKESSSAISESITRQSTATTQIAESIEELTITVNSNSATAQQLKEISQISTDKCKSSQQTYYEISAFLDEIKFGVEEIKSTVEYSQENLARVINFLNQVETKTKIINDIVFQTKLLSFNASVEAARAGELGKGFSVVAEEVGKLATLSGTASNEISELLSNGVKETKEIIQNMGQSIHSAVERATKKIEMGQHSGEIFLGSLASLLEDSNLVSAKASEIETALKEQSTGIQQINLAIKSNSVSINELSPASKNVEEAADAFTAKAESLDHLIEDLNRMV